MKNLFVIGVVAIVLASCQSGSKELSFEERADTTIAKMTLEEKVSQLVNESAAIPRLGITEYNWWNECLHGVARAGEATVFPQTIGWGATFNEELIFEVADAISTEARAKHHEAAREGDYGWYKGLTMWTPNINIFRDPRWGRGQETYGEDPFLTSRIGVQFVNGLQGTDEKYFKCIATPKHYAVHNGPEKLRHEFDVDVSERDLWETYLPAFEATIKEAGAFSIMSAYNRFRGESCSAHPYLLNELLRDKWGFKGYVVSDCGAIRDIYKYHKLVKTAPEAAALAIRNGCDNVCAFEPFQAKEAVEQGLLKESEIDTVIKRLLMGRFKLGMFDDPAQVPYAHIPIEENNSTKHDELALRTCHESIVLLQNKNNTLPLKKDVKSIAVIGPNADLVDPLLGNYHGTPTNPITLMEGIKQVVGENTEIKYHRATGHVFSAKDLSTITKEFYSYKGKTGLFVEYFDNDSLGGDPVETAMNNQINFVFGDHAPSAKQPANHYSIRWTGTLTPKLSGEYVLSVKGDDGYRLFIDGKEVIEMWSDHASERKSTDIQLEGGRAYDFKLEYYENIMGADISVDWSTPDTKDPIEQAAEMAASCDAIIFAGGYTEHIEGEEMAFEAEGFDRGDRTTLHLPKAQTDVLKALHATGKPVILVLMNGGAIALNWEHENLAAIIEAWYPGQNGGRAIADVIFGDYNPAGRLPVTFYKSVNDLPAFTNYNMADGFTYRYFKGEPLYEFGYGLSYTTFEYSNLQLASNIFGTEDIIKVKFNVTNSGEYDGDEVVQLYVKHTSSPYLKPLKELKAFDRIHVKKGETKKVELNLKVKDLRYYLEDKKNYEVELGTYEFFVGTSSNDPRLKGTFAVK